jgi:hypothetical protein
LDKAVKLRTLDAVLDGIIFSKPQLDIFLEAGMPLGNDAIRVKFVDRLAGLWASVRGMQTCLYNPVFTIHAPSPFLVSRP